MQRQMLTHLTQSAYENVPGGWQGLRHSFLMHGISRYMTATFVTYLKLCLCCCDIFLQGRLWNQRLASVLKEWQCHPVTCPDRTNQSRDKHGSVSHTEVSVNIRKERQESSSSETSLNSSPPSLTAMATSYFSLLFSSLSPCVFCSCHGPFLDIWQSH